MTFDTAGDDVLPAGDAQAMRQLWAGVLHLAVLDAQGRGWAKTRSTEKGLRDRARAWLGSPARGVGSFVWVCDLLDIAPEQVRARVVPVRGRGRVGP